MIFIDPKIVAQFTHDAIKPVRLLLSRFELETLMPEAVTPLDEKSRKMWMVYLESLGQALEDFRGLASCAMMEEDKWELFDWKDLIREHAEMLRKKDPMVSVQVQTGSFPGQGKVALLQHALYDMAWFVRHFSNRVINIICREGIYQERRAIELIYEIETLIELGPDFCEAAPFIPMSQEDRTLKSNTGLILYTVKRISELYGGTIAIQTQGKKVLLTLIFPIAVP